MGSENSNLKSIESLAKEMNDAAQVVRLDALIVLTYTAEAVNRYLDQRMQNFKHDQTRLRILYLLIGNKGSMTPTNISKAVNRSKHAITRAIDFLEKDKLVKREASSNDRRSLNVLITKQGIDLVKKSLPALHEANATATSCLTEKQIDDLVAILNKLRKWVFSSLSEE